MSYAQMFEQMFDGFVGDRAATHFATWALGKGVDHLLNDYRQQNATFALHYHLMSQALRGTRREVVTDPLRIYNTIRDDVRAEDEAEEMVDDMERGRTEQVEALLGWSWLWDRMQEGMILGRDDVEDALLEAIADDVLGGSRAPGWVRRERRIRELIAETRKPIPDLPDSGVLTPRERRAAIKAGRDAYAVEEIARIVGER